MSRFNRLLWTTWVAAALCLGGAAAFAADVAPASKPQKVLLVLTPDQVDAHRFIAPPAAEGSEQHQRDRDAVRRAIAAATPERLAQAKWDDDHEDPSAYYATIGDGFDLKTLPATAALFAVVMNDQSFAASKAKKSFPRLRPWASDATIKTCDPDDKPLTSYPSGHATMGFATAVVLATLMPEKASAIQVRAADYAFSRQVCGSHYPSDSEASHVLGTALALELLASPVLQSKIAASRAELRAAHFTAQ